MNKRGEIFSGLFFILLVVGGIMFFKGVSFNEDISASYIADASNNAYYNLRSGNPDCNLKDIKIREQDIRTFKSESDIPPEYTIDSKCF